jgi:hypothetical protein
MQCPSIGFRRSCDVIFREKPGTAGQPGSAEDPAVTVDTVVYHLLLVDVNEVANPLIKNQLKLRISSFCDKFHKKSRFYSNFFKIYFEEQSNLC